MIPDDGRWAKPNSPIISVLPDKLALLRGDFDNV
jgi:hypothetical protein